jgi:phage terminase large subunit-like protein
VPRKKSQPTKLRTSLSSTVRDLTPEGQQKYERVVHFFEKILRHSKGQNAGKPFTLLPWQHHVMRELFGRLNPDGTRQHRVGYIELPKKQGKSTTLAGIALYMTAFDSEPGAEVYGAACDREQAGIIYREAASMVRASPALSRHLEVIDSRKTIVHKKSNSFYRVLSADAFRAEGLNIHALLFDELHAQRDRRLWAFAPGREAGGEGPAQQEMHSGTEGRLEDHHSCSQSPRRALTASRFAGSSTPMPSGVWPTLR